MLQRANADLDQALAEARPSLPSGGLVPGRRRRKPQKFMPGGNTRTILYHAPFPLRAAAGAGR